MLIDTEDLIVQDDCRLLEAVESVAAALFDSQEGFHFVLSDLTLVDDEIDEVERLASESTRCGHKSVVVASMLASLFWH